MSDPTFHHEVVIDAPIDEVWRLTEDIESWPSFTPTITQVVRLDQGPLRPGSTARVTQPGLGSRVWTVTTVRSPAEFAWQTTLAGTTMLGTHELVADGSRCRNRLTLTLSGPTARLLAALTGKRLRAALSKENAGLLSRAENPV